MLFSLARVLAGICCCSLASGLTWELLCLHTMESLLCCHVLNFILATASSVTLSVLLDVQL